MTVTSRSSRHMYVDACLSEYTGLPILQGQGPYAGRLKKIESDIKEVQKRINEKLGACVPPCVCWRGLIPLQA